MRERREVIMNYEEKRKVTIERKRNEMDIDVIKNTQGKLSIQTEQPH